jgi:ribonuclease VapC
MVIDTSVLIAIAFGEPDASSFEAAMEPDQVRLISAASVLEASIVMRQKFGLDGAARLDELMARWPLQVVPFDSAQLRWARFAVETYGRGQHPAKLNFGDCFTYALAKSASEPVLFKGTDFTQTDVLYVS